jgi:hypothetical protein
MYLPLGSHLGRLELHDLSEATLEDLSLCGYLRSSDSNADGTSTIRMACQREKQPSQEISPR